MFSLDTFKKNYCPFLKEPDKIVTYDPVHYHMIDLNTFDEEYKKHFPDYSHYLTGYTQRGLAYTGLSEGTIYAIFGFYQLWKGNAEFFLIPSKHINRKAMVFHKVSLQFFEYVANIMHGLCRGWADPREQRTPQAREMILSNLSVILSAVMVVVLYE